MHPAIQPFGIRVFLPIRVQAVDPSTVGVIPREAIWI